MEYQITSLEKLITHHLKILNDLLAHKKNKELKNLLIDITDNFEDISSRIKRSKNEIKLGHKLSISSEVLNNSLYRPIHLSNLIIDNLLNSGNSALEDDLITNLKESILKIESFDCNKFISEELNTKKLIINSGHQDHIFKQSLSLEQALTEYEILLDKSNQKQESRIEEIRSSMAECKTSIENIERIQLSSTKEINIKINTLQESSNNLESEITNRLSAVTNLYNDSITEIKQKKTDLYKQLGLVSGTQIAGSYEKSASDEKLLADRLRYASIACMGLIVIFISYTFWETTTEAFKWENAVFRIVLAFLLSVPSAYLARESAKHREQQYNHLQTSLDLKAINPYIASLPEDQQHKIKADIADRIFASRDFSSVGKDPYPINTQEMIMELIKKLDSNTERNPDKKEATT